MAGLPSETQLQSQIVQGLRLRQLKVLQCGHFTRQVECPRCAFWFTPTSGYGNDLGVPDLLVTDPTWPAPVWVGAELKRPSVQTTIGLVRGGVLSPEQRDLARSGLIVVCRSLEDVLAAVADVPW